MSRSSQSPNVQKRCADSKRTLATQWTGALFFRDFAWSMVGACFVRHYVVWVLFLCRILCLTVFFAISREVWSLFFQSATLFLLPELNGHRWAAFSRFCVKYGHFFPVWYSVFWIASLPNSMAFVYYRGGWFFAIWREVWPVFVFQCAILLFDFFLTDSMAIGALFFRDFTWSPAGASFQCPTLLGALFSQFRMKYGHCFSICNFFSLAEFNGHSCLVFSQFHVKYGRFVFSLLVDFFLCRIQFP